MLEAVETLGITAQELSLFIVGQFRGFLNKVVRHAVGNGCNGTRIVLPSFLFFFPPEIEAVLRAQHKV